MNNDSGNQKPVQKFYTPLEKALQAEEERVNARQQELNKQYSDDVAGGDRKLDNSQQHSYTGDTDAAKKNFDQKIYMFPESFNALRRELVEHWPVFFTTFNEVTGASLAHDMVYNAAQFVGTMNGALDLNVQMDSDNVDGICKIFLDELRVKRGLSRLH